LVSPASRYIKLVGIDAYRISRVGIGWINAYQGNLPKTCPQHFSAQPVSMVSVKGHSSSPWMIVVALRMLRQGHYHLGKVKINYLSAGHRFWQYYYLNTDVIGVVPRSDPRIVQITRCG
jgi:hypothetical protein